MFWSLYILVYSILFTPILSQSLICSNRNNFFTTTTACSPDTWLDNTLEPSIFMKDNKQIKHKKEEQVQQNRKPTSILDDIRSGSKEKTTKFRSINSIDATTNFTPSPFSIPIISSSSNVISAAAAYIKNNQNNNNNNVNNKNINSKNHNNNNVNDNDNNANNNKRAPFPSFEEWQRKIKQSEEKNKDDHIKPKRKPNRGSNLQGRQMIDSLDGDFSDDVGSVFEGNNDNNININNNGGNNYDEGEYINPQKQQQKNNQQHNFAKIPLKSLKNRFNYAAQICAASVRDVNKEAKGSQSILYESKDQYLLNKCNANKFVVINLCEEILIDTIVLANFEFFSSTFKDFRVYAANNYPTNNWKLLGQWQARNTRDLQVFKVQDRVGWFEYIKIEFLTHYGHEYYCPLSLVRVHGMPMMEYYYVVEREGLGSEDSIGIINDQSLWPADVREEIIHPQKVTNTSEWFPTKTDNVIDNKKDEEEDLYINPSFNITLDSIDSILIDEPPLIENNNDNSINENDNTIQEDINITEVNERERNLDNNDQRQNTINADNSNIDHSTKSTISEVNEHIYQTNSQITTSHSISTDIPNISSSTEIENEDKKKNKVIETEEKNDFEKEDIIGQITNVDTPSTSILSSSSSALSSSSERDDSSSDNSLSSSSTHSTPSETTHMENIIEISVTDTTNKQNEILKTTTTTMTSTLSTTQPIMTTPNTHANIEDNSNNNNNNNNNNNRPIKHITLPNKEPTTQESIYKIIMKRITALEINATLSQRYLDEQNNMLNDVFLEMEKRQQEQLIMILDKLNETASQRIDNIKKRYEKSYGELKEKMETDIREISTKINILTDQLSFERKVSMIQLLIVVALFVFLALSRGTLNALSPVVAAQAEERKRRESDGKLKQQEEILEKKKKEERKRMLLKRNLHESVSSITSYTRNKLDSTILSSTSKIKLDMDGKKQSTLEELKLHLRQQAELLPKIPKPSSSIDMNDVSFFSDSSMPSIPPPNTSNTSSSVSTDLLSPPKSLNRKSISLQDISNNNNNNNNNTSVNNTSSNNNQPRKENQ